MGKVGKLSQRYEPRKFEPEILRYWDENRVYEKLRASLSDKPKFYFLDGPPYPSSDTPHIGTIWNKVLKDVVIRFRRAQGYNVNDQPGYDCHGLPIEVKIEQKLGFKSKKDIESYGVDRFVKACEEFALSNVKSMSRYFKEFGVSMDWKNPYLTLKPEYIQSAWWLVKRAEERGLLERGVKVVHWCPRCETTLADYEVSEYTVLRDPSIYVKFPVKGGENEYILIWTTTPWTLPANVAVMAHPDFTYVWVKVNGEKLLLLKDRLEAVMKEAGVEEYEVVAEVKGRELEGLEYVHPLEDEVKVQKEVSSYHRIVLSDKYVTAEEGTGLVHTAPGHGEEDFEVGQEYGLPAVAPVDDRGVFTADAGKYVGLYVRDANKAIIEDLKRKGALFHEGYLEHRYPICWRCKTPLILRATTQWYIRVKHLKEKFLEEAQKVNWVPEWAGYARFKNWLEGLRDWVISRQRYWGTPVPIWVCESCGNRVVIGSKKELEEYAGRKLELEDLHRPWVDQVTFKCPKCGGVMRRVPDVLDVWLDSGVAFYASLNYPLEKEKFEKLWPVDFITEGHDQIAGWFFSLLRSGIITMDQAPYKTVLMHGFALDEKGQEIHKSLGNYFPPEDAIERPKGGRDALRWFVLRNTVWEDLRFSWKTLDTVWDDLQLVWNVYYFASTYMSLDEFDPDKYTLDKVWEHLRPEDKWLLSRTESLVRDVTRWMSSYQVHRAARALRDFIVEDVSHWYIRLVRPRVWVEKEDPGKLAAYATLYYALDRFLRLAAPIIPFVTEKIYLDAFKTSPDKPESVHMLSWPEHREDLVNEQLERQMRIVREVLERALALRMEAGVKVRQPLPALYVLSDDEEVSSAVNVLGSVLTSQANVKKVEVKKLSDKVLFIETKVKPVYRVLGPKFKAKAGRVAEALTSMDENELAKLLESGSMTIEVDGEKVEVSKDMVELEETYKDNFRGTEFSKGLVILDTKITEAELAEGLARDVIRRIQFMRKEMQLPVDAFIDVEISMPSEARRLLEKHKDYVAGEVRARKLLFSGGDVAGEYVKTWEIMDYKVKIAVTRVR